MKILSKLALVFAVALLAASWSGCVAVMAGAAGAGTVAYVRGELASSLDANFDRTVRAVNRAVGQLQFARVSEKQDALVAVIIARTAEDKRIEVKVSKVGETSSKVQIRVGVFGDEQLSQAVLDKIKANL